MCTDLEMLPEGITVVQVEAMKLLPTTAVGAHGAVSTPMQRDHGAHHRSSALRAPVDHRCKGQIVALKPALRCGVEAGAGYNRYHGLGSWFSVFLSKEAQCFANDAGYCFFCRPNVRIILKLAAGQRVISWIEEWHRQHKRKYAAS